MFSVQKRTKNSVRKSPDFRAENMLLLTCSQCMTSCYEWQIIRPLCVRDAHRICTLLYAYTNAYIHVAYVHYYMHEQTHTYMLVLLDQQHWKPRHKAKVTQVTPTKNSVFQGSNMAKCYAYGPRWRDVTLKALFRTFCARCVCIYVCLLMCRYVYWQFWRREAYHIRVCNQVHNTHETYPASHSGP
jgi:hypothetical protein